MPAAICVSIVVPVRDEAHSVEALIRGIGRQVRPPDEVVIVDGGSTDGTPDLVRGLTAGDERYRLIEAGPATPGRGRNVGTEAAAHPWVAYSDAGIDLDPHWLDRLVRVVEHDAEIDVVHGSVSAGRGSSFTRCADLAYGGPLVTSPVGPVRPRTVPSSLLRKEVWRQAGGFPDLRAAEDLIFLRRLDALGCTVATAPEARAAWHLQPTARRTFERFRCYSMHNVLAGQQRYWHHGVARQYVALAGAAALARAAGRSPAPLMAAAGGLRVGRTLWRRREGRGIGWVLRPDRFAMVAAILVLVDAATFTGWIDAILVRHGLRSAS